MFKTKTKRLFFASILFFLFLNIFISTASAVDLNLPDVNNSGLGTSGTGITDNSSVTTTTTGTGTTSSSSTTGGLDTQTTPGTNGTTTSGSTANTGLVGCDTNCTFDNLITMVNTVINFIVFNIVPPIAVVTVVIAAINLMTSAGDPGKLEQAKKTIIWIILGLVVIYGAWAIVKGFITALGGGGETLKFFGK